MKKTILLIVLCSLLICCNRDPVANNENGSDLFYPARVGNKWQYQRIAGYTSCEPESLYLILDPADTLLVDVEVIDTRVFNDTINTFIFSTTTWDDTTLIKQLNFYENRPEGLFGIAYSPAGAPIIFPKRKGSPGILVNSQRFNSVHELSNRMQLLPEFKNIGSDSVIIEEPPVCTLKYPLAEGLQWTYRNIESGLWKMDKIVIDESTINRLGRNFQCYRIRWLYDINHDQIWDDQVNIIDYVAKEGLIDRKVVIKNIYFLDEAGSVLGTTDFEETYNLTKIDVQINTQEDCGCL